MHEMNQSNKNSLSVHFIGGEGINWALDEDLRLARSCTPDFVKPTDFDQADVIYSIWPGALEALNPARLDGKVVVCEFDNPPYHWVKQTSFRRARKLVSLWVTHTSQATQQAEELGLTALPVPYRLDGSIFFSREANCSEQAALRQRYAIPADHYVIGNFHRDSEGGNLQSPKLQKGPDVFLRIVLALAKKNYLIYILLAGPRRHWLRSKLELHGIPYAFVGKTIEGDDIGQNILPRQDLNDLYTCLDLVLITSRWEGGPYSVLEAAATRRKVLSSRVGLAEDVLEPQSIFDHPDQAVEIIERDIQQDVLRCTIEPQYERYLRNHTLLPAQEAMKRVFQNIKALSAYAYSPSSINSSRTTPLSSWHRLLRRLGFARNTFSQKSVSMLREFHKPPYGGGNQFMLALKAEFEKMGVRVLNNEIGSHVNAYLFDSIWFDLKLLDKLARLNNPRVGHRIDGPIHLYRGQDKELDEKIFNINRQFASISIIQSIYTLRSIYAAGYSPTSPIVIPNAVNSDIFFPKPRLNSPSGKIKLVSTSWSDNPMKGADDYKWIDENLDFSRYSYTFFGRIKERFKNIVVKPPLPSGSLGKSLREHDIYITASRNDPCSNALIEAMACGLPALYKNSGGHPELVGFGGLPYAACSEIPDLLERLNRNYELFSGCLSVVPVSQIAKRYLDALFSE
jgi:glycosyltransferase involved in cell wall biosynthesis